MPASTANAIFALSSILITPGIIGMVYMQSALLGFASVAVAGASYVWLWHRSALAPVSRERVAVEQRVQVGTAIIAATLKLFS